MAEPRGGTPSPSADATEHAKWRAYPSTVLEFPGPPPTRVDLRAPVDEPTRRALGALGLDGPFAVLTAENPEGHNTEDARSPAEQERRDRRNEERTEALARALQEAGVDFRPVDGVAPDGSYREQCVAVRLSREDAARLAERLRQLALFWYDGHAFWLLPARADQPPTRLPAAS